MANPLERFPPLWMLQGMLQDLVPPAVAALEALVALSAEAVQVVMPQSRPVAAMGQILAVAALEALVVADLKSLVLPVS